MRSVGRFVIGLAILVGIVRYLARPIARDYN
jgi:hypothetical protein